MWSQKVIVAVFCLLTLQHVTAVVNSGSSKSPEKSQVSSVESSDSSKDSASSDVVPDSIAASSEDKSNRREASLPSDTYLPSGPSNVNLPVPVYGVPDAPSNNIVYPAPPPDIPPLQTYGAPQVLAIPEPSYAPLPASNFITPPSGSYGTPPSGSYGPPPPSLTYGVPSLSPPPKFYVPRPHKYKSPRPQYGPPKQYYPKKHYSKGNYRPSKPSPAYGVPPPTYYKDKFNLNSGFAHFSHGSQYGAPIDTSLLNVGFGISGGGHGVSTQYGAPPDVGLVGPIHTSAHYGPPEPSPNPKPPHPGAPAPPTPPDIKYDGWQPIPGLVSRRPTDTYGVPAAEQHIVGDLSYNNDLIPPPLGHGGIGNDISLTSSGHDSSVQTGTHDIGHAASLALSNNFAHQAISDSYGAPLNTVTGSGGIVSSSGEDIHSSGGGQSYQHQQQHQHQDTSGALALGLSGLNLGGGSTIQSSIGYEIFPQTSDSYGAPPPSSYAPSGPYAAAHSYSNQGFGSHGSHSSHSSFSSHSSHHGHKFNSHRGYKGLSLSSSGIGLIPPSGVYGAPSGQHGTPLYTGLNLTPPKSPIVFDSHSHSTSSGAQYLPPVSNDIAKPPEPSSLYSLPQEQTAISFQNVNHGSSISGLSSFNTGLNIEGAQAQALTSYNVPLSIVDGTYSNGGHGALTVGIDHSHQPINIDLTGGLLQNTHNYQSSGYHHDCSLHSSQPLPSLSYGVPSVNSYTAALSSLTTNIGGSYAQATPSIVPHATYGVPDLSTAHSQKTEAKANSINEEDKDDTHGKEYGKTVAESFGPNSELIKSQSLDLNNIPLQGNLGSYTLQIQSSTGETNTQVPHSQVLNDGLLQSILAAIEQPQQNGGPAYIVQQPGAYIAQQSLPEIPAEPEAASSEKVAKSTDDSTVSESKDSSLSILDNNEIALYFSNDKDRYKKQTSDEGNAGENTVTEEAKDVVTNGH